jgi:hypothetical protein
VERTETNIILNTIKEKNILVEWIKKQTKIKLF